MTGEHPWREWAEVVGILAVGIAIVVAVVRLIIRWSQDDKPPGQ
jgi:Ni/Fe-hydrogenase subunit HybB-like protein